MSYHPPPYGGSAGAGPPWQHGPARFPGGDALPLAGGGQRFGARVIDYVIVGVVAGLLVFAILGTALGVTDSDGFGDADGAVSFFVFFAAWGIWLFLYDWLCLMAWGTTPGKAAVGLKVVSLDGGRLTQGQGLGRAAMFGLPQSLFCIGHLYVLIESLVGFGDRNRQSLHDKGAGTLVVRSR